MPSVPLLSNESKPSLATVCRKVPLRLHTPAIVEQRKTSRMNLVPE